MLLVEQLFSMLATELKILSLSYIFHHYMSPFIVGYTLISNWIKTR